METHTYRLLKDVTHRGVFRPAGTLIEYDDATAQWAAEQGVIAMVGGIFNAPKKSPEPPASTLPDGGIIESLHRVFHKNP